MSAHELKTPYKLSRDYAKLFELLAKGNTAVGFVDFRFNSDARTWRDVVGIERSHPWSIAFYCRGRVYGDIDPSLQETYESRGKAEGDAFAFLCEALNLEWIEP